jgi:hypothetical protein
VGKAHTARENKLSNIHKHPLPGMAELRQIQD